MRILIVIFVLVAAAVYWFVWDGSTPRDAQYEFPIEEMRALIDSDDGALPLEINVEIVSTDEAPALATHAGFNTSLFQLATTSYQVKRAGGDFILDSAMDESLFELARQSKTAKFSHAAYNRMLAAMATSEATLVTHEHNDHLGGIVRAPGKDALAPRLMLSQMQIDAIAVLASDSLMPESYQALEPVDLSSPRLLAPGLAVAPAPGHTPGSIVFLVRTQAGQEYLLLGDIVWSMENVEKAWGRPRVLQHIFFPVKENREKVQRQVRALHDLAQHEPDLVMLPSHDKKHLDQLIASGKLGAEFQQ